MARAKRQTTKRTTKAQAKRGSGRRTLVKNRAGRFFARRTGSGRFREMDERGRALRTDRRRKTKTVAKPGRGDRGDRKR